MARQLHQLAVHFAQLAVEWCNSITKPKEALSNPARHQQAMYSLFPVLAGLIIPVQHEE
jgi:hypothetical protein